ncbi:deoxyribose-phosphate aldolase [Cardiobacteriaceae bacterium TAE3-ERU3]|nr:deoxyribose-phosphate aldolase [Cardiobacteriaceae bacterium TAE3-ERU3]
MSTFNAQQIVALIDLTSLNETDTPADIHKLCSKASNSAGTVAAVCVYPHLIKAAREGLEKANISGVAIATVVNFPHGRDSVEKTVHETRKAIEHGADEIDVVLPYEAMMKGDEQHASELLTAVCQEAHAHKRLVKVILETGALETEENIIRACELSIEAGTDFLKTSTGKIKVGATPEAVDLMIESINAEHVTREVGIKISGGVRTQADAQNYLELIESRMSDSWINPQHVRIGASSLLDELLQNNQIG